MLKQILKRNGAINNLINERKPGCVETSRCGPTNSMVAWRPHKFTGNFILTYANTNELLADIPTKRYRWNTFWLVKFREVFLPSAAFSDYFMGTGYNRRYTWWCEKYMLPKQIITIKAMDKVQEIIILVTNHLNFNLIYNVLKV